MNLKRGGRDNCAGVGLYPWVARCVDSDDGTQILSDSYRQFEENPFYQGGLGCDTWPYAVGSPIRKVFLMLNNLRVHHSKPVKAWALENAKNIELFYLPSDSSELNPEERLNADLKRCTP